LKRGPVWLVPVLLLSAHPSTAQTTAGTAASNGDSVCLNEILISTPLPYDANQVADAQRKAEGARAAIQQGAKFEDVAKMYSDGPSAAYGGAVGAFKRGQLAKQIEDKVFAMKVGDVSDVIRTKQGFTILQVTECNPVIGMHGRWASIQVQGDEQGLEIGAYAQRVNRDLQARLYRQIFPQSAATNKATVSLDFSIMKDGSVTNMRLVTSSGDATLDRAAWAVVAKSQPFPRLPSEFTGSHLAVRLLVVYK